MKLVSVAGLPVVFLATVLPICAASTGGEGEVQTGLPGLSERSIIVWVEASALESWRAVPWSPQPLRPGPYVVDPVARRAAALLTAPPGACSLEDGAFRTEEGGCRDLASGLVWSQWSIDSMTLPAVATWEGAQDLCANLDEGGATDWFLPSKDQLLEVHQNGAPTHFNWQPAPAFSQWSSTDRGKQSAWVVKVFDGSTWTILKPSTWSFVCARVPPAPGIQVTQIFPPQMMAGETISVTITGADFVAGATVTFEKGPGPTPVASNVTVVDATTIEADVSVGTGGGPPQRVWDVRVTNPDESSAVLIDGFTVFK